jgi:hypothetical protein
VSYRLPAPPGALPVIRSGYRPDVYGFGGLFPPGVDLDLSVSDETRRRIAGWPAASASGGVVESPRSGTVLLLLAVLGLAAIGGAFWVARSA